MVATDAAGQVGLDSWVRLLDDTGQPQRASIDPGLGRLSNDGQDSCRTLPGAGPGRFWP